jgi:hypothetical protein
LESYGAVGPIFSGDSDCSLEDIASDSSRSTTPVPCEPASCEIDVILNNKKSASLDKRNLHISNWSYDEFLEQIDKIAAKKAKLALTKFQSSSRSILWLWMTVSKSQSKTSPRLNALDDEDHFRQLQKDIQNTARKTPDLANMVLRLKVDITTNDVPEVDQQDVSLVEQFPVRKV